MVRSWGFPFTIIKIKLPVLKLREREVEFTYLNYDRPSVCTCTLQVMRQEGYEVRPMNKSCVQRIVVLILCKSN